MSTKDKGKRKVDDRSPQANTEEPSLRRMRVEMETSFDLCSRMTTAMDDFKLKVSTTLTCMAMDSNPSNLDLKAWMEALANTQVCALDNVTNLMSEIVTEMETLNKDIKGKDNEIRELKEELKAQSTVVKAVVVTKDKIEAKASSKEMEEKLKVAVTQFKVMDIDIGKETENRQEIINIGMTTIRQKIRSDLQDEWMQLAERVEVTPLVKRTSKPTGKSFYTAPLLFTVPEKRRRWRMEEILRMSKIFPGFHWPQEMMPVIKEYKTMLKDNGVNEDNTYVRIRPNERDGKVRLRADVKGKEGNGKFQAKASWDAPPLCHEVRRKTRDYLKPQWASVRN